MLKSTGYIAAASALLFTFSFPQAHAAFIIDGNYVRAQVDANVNPGSGTGGVFPDADPVTADTGTRDFSIASWSASGRGLASIATGLELKATSTSTAPPSGTFFPPSSTLNTTSSWRDVLTPSGPGAPTSLNFNFSVHGILTVSQTTNASLGSNVSQAQLTVGANDNIISYASPDLLRGPFVNVRNVDGVASTRIESSPFLSWNSSNLVPLGTNQYEFFGDFTFAAPLLSFGPSVTDAPFGAYFMSASVSAFTNNVGGTSTVDAFNTLTLDSITTPGGALISADDFAFESGAAVNAVIPVPAALWLFISGLLGFLGITRHTSESRKAAA